MIVTGPTFQTGSPALRDNAPGTPVGVEQRGIELREAMQILLRRRWVPAGAVALGIAVAALAIFITPNRFSATATVEVNRDSNSSLGLTDLAGAAGMLGDSEGMNIDLLTQQAVISSDNTVLRAIEDLKLDSTPPYAIANSSQGAEPISERDLPLEHAPLRRERALRIFRSGLRVNPIKGTRLLAVTFTDTDPNRAAAVANTIVEAYRNESTRARFQASSKASTWLTSQLADLKHRVENSQARVDAFQRTSGLAGASAIEGQLKSGLSSGPDNVALARLVELNRNLTSAEVARIAREAIYTMAQTQDPEVVLGVGSGPLAAEAGMGSPLAAHSADLTLLDQLYRELAQARVKSATEGTKYGARNPAMIQLANQQASLEAQIHEELDHIRSKAKNDLDLAVLDERGIRKQIAEQEHVVNQVAEKSDQLLLLEEEARSSREIYQDLYTKLEEASVTAGLKASNITLVDPARTPASPSSPRKRMLLALGSFAGLVFGLITAFAWDYFDDSVAAPEETERITGLPVIGAIPDFCQRRSPVPRNGHQLREHVSPARETETWLLRSPRSRIAEAYRALRTAMLLSRTEEAPHTVLFTSGSPNEGKSTTCFNAAAAFAVQGDRVLYLDADLRRAKGHTLFGCPNDQGLSNCLASGLPFPAALKSHPEIATLFVLPAGPHPPNPAELLGSRRFADLLGDLRAHFDYIFIDSPPVLLVTDAQLIAPHAEGCVLVLRAHKTQKRFLHRSLAHMRTTKASMLGLVVNALKRQAGAHSEYAYYEKGMGYYAEE